MKIENVLKNKSNLTDDQKLAYLGGVWPFMTTTKHKNILINFIEKGNSSHDFAELKQFLCVNGVADRFHLSSAQKQQISTFSKEYQSWLIELFIVKQVIGEEVFLCTENELLEFVANYVDSEEEFEYELLKHINLLDELEIDGESVLFDCEKNEDIDFLRVIQHDIKSEAVKVIMSLVGMNES